MHRWGPKNLQGQLMLAIGLALLLAQTVSAGLRWRAQSDRREAAIVHTAAIRLIEPAVGGWVAGNDPRPGMVHRGPRNRAEFAPQSPIRRGEVRLPDAEQELRRIIGDEFAFSDLVVFRRPLISDPRSMQRWVVRARRNRVGGRAMPSSVLIAAVRIDEPAGWLVARVPEPRIDRSFVIGLLAQTLLLYTSLIGAAWLIVRRITRPLAALTSRVEHFAETRDAGGQLDPQGPDDVRRLIVAHNAMEARVAALLDEKDVMLGAIGHDLKTPLSALRVRIESVEDVTERAKMAATIEDITRSLDDILSLARVGRPSDPREATELAALVAQVAEEFEDLGEPVTLGDTPRLTLPVRVTWLRRALRNLISNALRYGGEARVSLAREGDAAVIRVADSGPGIPEGEIARMLEPFTRGEPSRNSETGGAGLGLTLARAIAEQHGGTLSLINTRAAAGEITGLVATIRLPA